MATATAEQRVCRRPETETLFTSLMGALLSQGLVPPGAILDAGAWEGGWACYYASLDRSRRVLAVDPDPYLVDRMRRLYHRRHSNLVPVHGALSERPAPIVSREAARQLRLGLFPLAGPKAWYSSRPNGSFAFPLLTLDELFAAEPLGFASLDLEGHELAALRGGRATLLRDRPIVATELMVHQSERHSRELLAFMAAAGYDSYLIEEIVGNRADIRNLLHLPRARADAFRGAHALDMAVAAKALFPVNAKTVLGFAFPCCGRGRECCPCGRQSARSCDCCSHWRVRGYLNRVLATGGEDVRRFARTPWYEQWWHVWHPANESQSRWQQRELLNRDHAQAGFGDAHMRG
jgi:FkbM family methyltransferase